jgi:NAD(P)-dependent dehydrogenase (short-subunit alcohol dehydrogenase family)
VTTTLITGANRGIGLALTKSALARGHDVIAALRRNDKTSLLHALDGDIEFLTLDVTQPTSLTAAAAHMGQRRIDVLIVNAGQFEGRGVIADAANDAATWNGMFATNVIGAFQTARTFLPQVIAAQGKIVFISSRMGSSTQAAGNAYAYRASKAAVSNIAANLAVELKPRGVAVASYHPGWVKTDMGGSGADITPEASARGLLDRIDALTLTSSGCFESYDGKTIPF